MAKAKSQWDSEILVFCWTSAYARQCVLGFLPEQALSQGRYVRQEQAVCQDGLT